MKPVWTTHPSGEKFYTWAAPDGPSDSLLVHIAKRVAQTAYMIEKDFNADMAQKSWQLLTIIDAEIVSRGLTI